MTEQEQPKTEQEILNSLEGYTWITKPFLKDSFRGCLLTEGFQEFLKLCSCEWLYSDIAIYSQMELLNKEDFIICRIEVNKDKKAEVKLYSDRSETDEDFNKEHLLYTQKYSYTDFPLKDYEFYIIFNGVGFTFMLKKEY